jgi:hypothetical protein
MSLRLHIATENAAFSESPASELARILRKLADRIESDPAPYIVLRDVNGNMVGECQISETEESEE